MILNNGFIIQKFWFFEFFENHFRKIALKSAPENEFHYNKIVSTTSDMYLYGREDRLWIPCFTENLYHEIFLFFYRIQKWFHYIREPAL